MSPSRQRTFYDDAPDYTRPLFRPSAACRSRLRERLTFLYGKEQSEAWLPELERIMAVHWAHKPPEMLEKEQEYDPSERFGPQHEILSTYGDIVNGEGRTPLAVLHDFVDALYPRAINTVHLLPFFPYSSDRGFSVVDYRRVDPVLGSWDDIRAKKERYDLMFDAVLNHCSSQSEMFREYLNGNPHYRDFFIAYDSPDELTADQRRKIFRPRTSDILTRFESLHGTKYVWTTFSSDQVDLNFRNPAVLMQVIESILFYIRRGADMLRLDAVTYIWAEPGTESAHLPQTHAIIKLLRDIVDAVALGVALVTETNVPYRENYSYFGDGTDQAHMIYQFALPSLVLHAFYRGDATAVTEWARQVHPPSDQATFLNFLDNHDGISLVGVRGVLPDGEVDFVIERAKARGALVSYKMTGDRTEEPYELNSTWWSAINGDDSDEPLELQAKRFLASRSLSLVLQGVPAIYVHGALGSCNDHRLAERTGIKRDLNRGPIDSQKVLDELKDPASRLSLLHLWGGNMVRTRGRHQAFHPRGEQRVLALSSRVFSLCRISPRGDEHVVALTNVTDGPVDLTIETGQLPLEASTWRDLLTGQQWRLRKGRIEVSLEPYDVVWLVPAGQK